MSATSPAVMWSFIGCSFGGVDELRFEAVEFLAPWTTHCRDHGSWIDVESAGLQPLGDGLAGLALGDSNFHGG